MKIDTKIDSKMDNGCVPTCLTGMPPLADMPRTDVKPSTARLNRLRSLSIISKANMKFMKLLMRCCWYLAHNVHMISAS